MATTAKKKDSTTAKKDAVITPADRAVAKSKFIRVAPSKLRRVATVIRGKDVVNAMAILKALPHRGAEVLIKVLGSAIANATTNHKMDHADLVVAEILVSEGPRFKRFKARARGRVNQIVKQTSHVYIALKAGGEQ